MSFDACQHVVSELTTYTVLGCLNDHARSSRLYWLTDLGVACQRQLFQQRVQRSPETFFPDVDWQLYGWVCFRHRAAIIKALTEPMQPSAIKRRARFHNPRLQMSANNTRDIVRLFLKRRVIRAVPVRKKTHLRYELTEVGRVIQELLCRAEVPT